MKIRLPPPIETSYPLYQVILKRRSRRSWTDRAVELEKISTILWAAQGITEHRKGFRAAPSAGATFPLETYLVVRNVLGLEHGIYHYIPYSHELELLKKGDYSKELEMACLGQSWVGSAAANIVLTAVFERTTSYYGRRGIGYVYIEVGHAGQNIYLMAEALDLGTVAIGAFYDEEVARIIGVDINRERPLYVMPIGYPR